MTCTERRDELLLYALGALDAPEIAALGTHLGTGCPRCAGHLAEARAVVAHLPLALAPAEPPIELRQRLLARVAQKLPAERPGWGWGPWLRPAVAAAVAAAVLLVLVVAPLRERLRVLDGELGAQRDTLERLRGDLGSAMEAVRLLASPRLELTLLASGAPKPETWGRILRDEQNRVWQLHAFGLEPLGPDRTYELWFITADDRKIPAGTFDADATGRAAHRVTLPRELDNIVAAAVTDEPAGGVSQPTGRIQLVARL